MTRLRDKGGANPNSLFELTNGYVTAARTIRSRPGTVLRASLPAETRGLCTYMGKLTTFCHRPVVVPDGYSVEIIGHPTQADLALREIHFAAPFLGFLYVVAEFANGDVFHFWLESLVPWQAGATILPGQTVSPTVTNGYLYQASRTDVPAQLWQPNINRGVGDVVEPRGANGFRYRVIATFGSRPASGADEPAWPTTPGGRVVESTTAPEQPPEPTPVDPTTPIREELSDRYFDLVTGRVRR